MLTLVRISLSFFRYVSPMLLIFLIMAVSIFDAGEEQASEIVRRAKEGDDESFATLYRFYYMPILRHLYRMVGNEEDAQDLAAVTFTRAWYSLPGVKDGRHFRGWLYKIATNAALDFIRSKKSKKSENAFSERLKEDYSDERATHFEDRVEEQELIRLAMDQVTPKPRACLILYEAGFGPEEIAEHLGMRKKSVITYISTARKQFLAAYHDLKNS